MATFTNQGSAVATYIRDDAPDSVMFDASSFYTGTYGAGELNRGLMKWDLSSIPAGAVVSSAILTIYVEIDYSANARVLSAYRVLRAWTTGGTWNKYDGTNAWGTAGCANTSTDREAAAAGTQNVSATQSAGDAIAITLDNTKVQEWISGALANNGVLLQVATENDDCYKYYNSGGATEARRPKLVIEYTSAVATANLLKFYRRTRFPGSITGV